MSGRLRYVLALAFVGLFFLFPEADHGQLAFLKTKAWLIDILDGEFAPTDDAAANEPAVPRPFPTLSVDYAAAGASTDTNAARRDELARILREWRRGNRLPDTAPAGASIVDLHLSMRIGDNGFEATLAAPSGGAFATKTLRLLRSEVASETSTAGAYYPDRYSLVPAFLAIILAILTGKVIPALLLGCFAGAVLFARGPWLGAVHLGAETIWGDVLTSQFNLEILGFVFFLFMTVGVMARSGGIQGMVEIVSRYARGPVSSQLAAWIIGILIFFDDYSNCIICGTTMRPLTDRCGVAREKLAYIVDSTAAPIAGVSIFSTWVAYEVSMFAPQLPEVTRADGTPYSQADGFGVFVQTLPLRFYCIFTLVFVLLTIVMRREFGPMWKAAHRAANEGKPSADDAVPLVAESLVKTDPPPGAPLRARNALLPIGVLVVATISLIVWFGSSAIAAGDAERPLIEFVALLLGSGESQRALCIAGILAFVTATLLAVGQRILTLGDTLLSALRSAQALVFAMVILVLAWAIGQICKDLGTAQYLTAAFHGSFEPWLLPAIMFGLASLVAFSTGTSYGTMSILLPNVVVLSHTMGDLDPTLGGAGLMILTIGAVLEGSIFGDHCSPISDTTVLSSVATGSDHMHHVRTQAPYALTVMAIALVCGYVPTALLGPASWPIAWLLGIAAAAGSLWIFGRRYRD